MFITYTQIFRRFRSKSSEIFEDLGLSENTVKNFGF